jgi:hypothetical protein
MTPTTTTMKQQSTSNCQVAEEEQQCNSAAGNDGGCQEKTAVEEGLCCSGRAFIGRGDGGATNAKSMSANKQLG